MRRIAAAVGVAVWLAVCPAAPAAQASWSPAQLEQQFMCLPCNQRLDQSESQFAQGLRDQI